MLKTIIMDDEPRICELIKGLVDWDRLGIEISGIAYDGQDGLELIEREKPDIVITDIRMPTLDGLSVIKQAAQLSHKSYFIVISGYQRFEYAQNALKYGVTDYLLKPINKEELTNTLEKIVNQINNEDETRKAEEFSRKQIIQNIQRIRQQALLDLINKGGSDDNLDILSINNSFHYKFEDGIFTIFSIKADFEDLEKLEFSQILLSRMEKEYLNIFKDNSIETETAISGTRLHVILNLRKEEERFFEKKILTLADSIGNILTSYPDFDLTVCTGLFVDEIGNLRGSLEANKRAEYLRIVHSINHISRYKPLNPNYGYNPFLEPQQAELKNIIETNQPDSLDDFLNDMFFPFEDEKSSYIDPEFLYNLCFSVLKTIEQGVEDNNSITGGEISFSSIHEAIDNSSTVPSLIRNFKGALINVLQPYFLSIQSQKNRPVRQAVKYIEEHYMEAIGLDTIARELGLSSAYFSSLFKKEAGCSFVEYLTTHRMETAKDLLRNTTDSITQIAEMTGYSDAKYFSKVFSKTYGISPNGYRKL